MRYVLHALATTIAVVAFLIWAPYIRTGYMSPFTAIVLIAMVLTICYGSIVVALGLLGGVPISKWPSIAKQLFRGHGRHDG